MVGFFGMAEEQCDGSNLTARQPDVMVVLCTLIAIGAAVKQ